MLTIVIPTKNRSDFLYRLLRYYATSGLKYPISIGDSSSGTCLQKNKETIEAFKDRLTINYYEYPDYDVSLSHKYMSQTITTPYMACLADGAFLVPSGLEKCVNFLEGHPDYSFANGKATLFHIDREGPHGQIVDIGEYKSMPLNGEEETASARIARHLAAYRVSLYCVHRTENWQAYWHPANLMRDRSFAGEFVPCCLSVTFGKSKQLDCLYLVRQFHERRTALPDVFDWVTSHDWSSSYEVFQDILVHALMDKDGISKEEAQKAVKQGFWHFMAKGLYGRYEWTHGVKKETLKSTIKNFIKRIMKSHSFFQKAEGMIFPLSLPGLMNKKSPYHEDFMPVYKAITEEPVTVREEMKVS